MGYFDYLDNKQKQEEQKVSIDEHSARVSFFIGLGSLAFLIVSIVFAYTIHFGVSLWFNVPNVLGIAVSVVAIILDQKTFKSFKKKRQSSPIANMSLALNILFILLNLGVIGINLMTLYYWYGHFSLQNPGCMLQSIWKKERG